MTGKGSHGLSWKKRRRERAVNQQKRISWSTHSVSRSSNHFTRIFPSIRIPHQIKGILVRTSENTHLFLILYFVLIMQLASTTGLPQKEGEPCFPVSNTNHQLFLSSPLLHCPKERPISAYAIPTDRLPCPCLDTYIMYICPQMLPCQVFHGIPGTPHFKKCDWFMADNMVGDKPSHKPLNKPMTKVPFVLSNVTELQPS